MPNLRWTTALLALALSSATAQFDFDGEDDDDTAQQQQFATCTDQLECDKIFEQLIVPAHTRIMEFDHPREEITAADAASTCAGDQLAPLIHTAQHKVVIIGSGPAGLTAALYAARADLKPLVLSADGGQLESTSWVDNYPGFEHGVDAVSMLQALEAQAKRFGATFQPCTVAHIDLSCRPFKVQCGAKADGTPPLTTSSLILATGAASRWLGVPGERQLLAKGVHTCATCDGYYYKEKRVAVVGGGDTAMEQALFLARLGTHVTVVHRRESFRASKTMAARVLSHQNITVLWSTKVAAFVAGAGGGTGGSGSSADKKLESLTLEHANGTRTALPTDGAFVAIGHEPNTKLLRSQGVKLDDAGYIITIPGSMRTSIVGVYAAGDVQDPIYRQAVTSAGSGAMAALDAERWLCEHGC